MDLVQLRPADAMSSMQVQNYVILLAAISMSLSSCTDHRCKATSQGQSHVLACIMRRVCRSGAEENDTGTNIVGSSVLDIGLCKVAS